MSSPLSHWLGTVQASTEVPTKPQWLLKQAKPLGQPQSRQHVDEPSPGSQLPSPQTTMGWHAPPAQVVLAGQPQSRQQLVWVSPALQAPSPQKGSGAQTLLVQV